MSEYFKDSQGAVFTLARSQHSFDAPGWHQADRDPKATVLSDTRALRRTKAGLWWMQIKCGCSGCPRYLWSPWAGIPSPAARVVKLLRSSCSTAAGYTSDMKETLNLCEISSGLTAAA